MVTGNSRINFGILQSSNKLDSQTRVRRRKSPELSESALHRNYRRQIDLFRGSIVPRNTRPTCTWEQRLDRSWSIAGIQIDWPKRLLAEAIGEASSRAWQECVYRRRSSA